MCSESRALQLQFSMLVEFCEQTSKYLLRWIMCQGLDPPGTDLKSIVGFCEQTSKSWPRWIKKTNVFRITSSTTSIFNFSRILWTNFKKLTEVDQKMKVFRITSSTTFISIVVGFCEQIPKMRVSRITRSTTFILHFSRILWTNFKTFTEVDPKMSVFSENYVQQLKTAINQNAHKTLLRITHDDIYDMYHEQTHLENHEAGGTGTWDHVRWKADDVFFNR